MPGVGTTAYPLVSDISQRVRAICNDMGTTTGVAGNLFADTEPYVIPLIQTAYERLRKILTRNGYEANKVETILTPILPVVSPDPGVQVVITEDGYNNGTTDYATPALPSDLIIPVRIWVRPTGSTSRFLEIFSVIDALPSIQQGSYLEEWQWREDGLWFTGATQSMDARMEYKNTFVPLTTLSQAVLIRDSTAAMAYLTLVVFAEGRGTMQPQTLEDWKNHAEEEIDILLAPTQQMKARQNPRRIPYGRSIWRR